MVHLAGVAGLDDDAHPHPRLLADQVMVHRGEHEQRRDGGEILVGVAVGQHEELGAGGDRLVGLLAHLVDALLHGVLAGVEAVEPLDGVGEPLAVLGADPDDLREFVVVDHREVEHDLTRVLGGGVEEVALGSQSETHRGDDLFADRVERRVGDLGERLGEVVEDEPRTLGQHGDRGVRTHRAEGLGAVQSHRADEDAHLLLGVAEGALAARDGGRGVHDVLARREVFELDAVLLDPLGVGLERPRAAT